MNKHVKLVLLAAMMAIYIAAPAQNRISLAGKWRFRIDREDQGIKQQWYTQQLKDSLKLPGTMQFHGYGDEPSVNTKWIGDRYEAFLKEEKYAPYRKDDNFKFPFWLTPGKYYMGAAWYQKAIDVPSQWTGKHISLTLERCHWGTMVYVDSQLIGADSSLATPHVYDLSHLSPGKHTLTIRVDNRYLSEVGINAHSASDQTQGTWNGIAGDIVLAAGSPVFVKQVQLYPDVLNKHVQVKVMLGRTGNATSAGSLSISADQLPALKKSFTSGDSILSFTYPMGDHPVLWDEFNPKLYQLRVQLRTVDKKSTDSKNISFGMRSVGTANSKITVNNRPVFLRGTLECAIFPLTGYPPTDTAAWARIFRIIKAHGLNHMRFHSWCPPEAAFVAADHAGVYLSVEVDCWASVGDGLSVDKFLYDESNRIVAAYGNHPSFLMMVPTNEPSGDKNRDPYLAAFVNYWKEKDNRRLYCAGSGWPAIAENDYHVMPEPRIQAWGEGVKSLINAKAPNSQFNFKDKLRDDRPVVAHEIGQWCVYPDFTERKKYTGLLQARNFDIFYDFMKKEHLQPQAHDFLMASGKLQALCYKADIEAGMRTDYAGYQLLDLHDFPGQGTALVGILDPFWDSKPYFTPAAFHRFSSSTVPLAVISKFTWKNSEVFMAAVQIAHFGKEQLKKVPVKWKITGNHQRVIANGALSADLDWKNDNPAGNISCSLSGISKAEKLNLEIIADGLGVNDWDFWVYPDTVNVQAGDDITVADALTPEIAAKLEAGATVLLRLNNKITENKGAAIKTGMSTVFWNTAWTEGQAPHTLGILCDPAAPLFKDFPTEYHSNWQWWDIIHTAQPMHLDNFPAELKPAVQLIDTWFEARKLGILFEAKVGKGKIVVTSIDLQHDLDTRLAARQLYHSLLSYMGTKAFNPTVAVKLAQIQELYD
ncbi:sugar-binding domain-containing protein [Chitinophaga filiformis]|uniref:beta-galactosidase n=1 Tax=Chitinophaga filiformis TaxID=104663 RepID=A0ABY4HZ41_CHIFI|nr:sugar-binding domain-containing protein [Chitinophaga filiformis]UPK69082.1 beta-galactosidase [Chitinophaga filiformis]